MLRSNRNDVAGMVLLIEHFQIQGGVACSSSRIGLRTSSPAPWRRVRHRAARARLACLCGCVHRHRQPMVQNELHHAIQRPGKIYLPYQIKAEAAHMHHRGHDLRMPLCTLQHCRLALAQSLRRAATSWGSAATPPAAEQWHAEEQVQHRRIEQWARQRDCHHSEILRRRLTFAH